MREARWSADRFWSGDCGTSARSQRPLFEDSHIVEEMFFPNRTSQSDQVGSSSYEDSLSKYVTILFGIQSFAPLAESATVYPMKQGYCTATSLLAYLARLDPEQDRGINIRTGGSSECRGLVGLASSLTATCLPNHTTLNGGLKEKQGSPREIDCPRYVDGCEMFQYFDMLAR